MKSNYISTLLSRFFFHSHSPELTRKVQSWIISPSWSAEKDSALHDIWEQINIKPDKALYSALEKVKIKIGIPVKRPRIHQYLLRVAAIVIPLSLATGTYFYFQERHIMKEITTFTNEQKHHTLPDGSEVWLNSDSKITYAQNFNDSTRLITLQGEACFSVKANPRKPFIVQTKDFEVKALGTIFNVYAYPSDSRSIATLTSGKVKVALKPHTQEGVNPSYILHPRQQLIYHKQEQNVTIDTIPEETTGWKEGLLIFYDATLGDIMNTLKRHYGIFIQYDPKEFSQDTYSVKFVNKESIDQVLNVLQDVTEKFSYEKKSNHIITIKIDKQHE